MQLLSTDGLDQVMVEPRFPRTLAVCLLAIPRHGDKHDVVKHGLSTHPPRDLKTVEARQADVQQHRIGSVGKGRLECSRAVMRRANIITWEAFCSWRLASLVPREC